MPIPSEDLDRRFDLHPATERTGPIMDELRSRHKALARQVMSACPPGRETNLALTAIESALFWANASVARASDDPPPPF